MPEPFDTRIKTPVGNEWRDTPTGFRCIRSLKTPRHCTFSYPHCTFSYPRRQVPGACEWVRANTVGPPTQHSPHNTYPAAPHQLEILKLIWDEFGFDIPR
jgi:hypothetical protein